MAVEIKTRYHGDVTEKHNQVKTGDSGVTYAILPGYVSLEEVIRLWEAAGYYPHRYFCSHIHDCCGCTFTYAVTVVSTPRRTLARQSFGRNV